MFLIILLLIVLSNTFQIYAPFELHKTLCTFQAQKRSLPSGISFHSKHSTGVIAPFFPTDTGIRMFVHSFARNGLMASHNLKRVDFDILKFLFHPSSNIRLLTKLSQYWNVRPECIHAFLGLLARHLPFVSCFVSCTCSPRNSNV